MPTFQIPVQITWSGASGSPGVNVWHGRDDSIPGDNIGELAAALQDFYTVLANVMPGTVDIDFLGEMQGVGDDTGNTYVTDPWHVDGMAPGGFLPPSQCILVNWRTLTGGRQGRGRTFLGPLESSTNEGNGTPAEAVRTAIQGAVDDLIEASDSFANGALGIYSRTGDTFRDLVSGSVPNFFAVLRSRRD